MATMLGLKRKLQRSNYKSVVCKNINTNIYACIYTICDVKV